MRFPVQVIALVFVSCGVMLPTEGVLAFGQQWRPAPNFLPVQAQVYGVGANMPDFRPRAAARPVYGRPYGQMQRRPYPQRIQQWPIAQHAAYAQGHRMPAVGPDYSAGYHQPQPRFAPPGYAFRPPLAASQTWMPQRRAPMFARQYGWRPAGQPWVARRARPGGPQQHMYQAQTRMPLQTAGFRPVGAGYPVLSGGWRPAARPAPALHPQYAYQGYGRRTLGYAAHRQPMFRSAYPRVWPMPDARMATWNPMPVVQPYWRPAPADAMAWHPDTSFRPAEYGRRLAGDAASPDGEASGFTRENLPGWVTTHKEADILGSCSWCSGS